MEITLNEKSKKSLEKKFGISISQMARMDVEDLDRVVEKQIKKKLTYQTRFKYLVGRGSIFLFLGRLLGIESVNKGLSKI